MSVIWVCYKSFPFGVSFSGDSFPEMQGFPQRNLKYIRTIAESWPDRDFMQRSVAQSPWRINLTLLEKLKDPNLRCCYAQQTPINGWSKNIREIQIDNKLHERVGQSSNNFDQTLPPVESDIINQIYKDLTFLTF